MSEKPARGRLGVDVGGTFTDLLLVDQASGAMHIAKVPSTPADQSDGFMAGLAALGDAADGFETVVHGTTVGTNAVLERKGVRCALITTQGFRDTLELGRRTRPNPWGMFGSFEPIVPRERRFEVTERIDASGAVVTALDEEEVRAAVQAARAAGTEALVIHFIHAYLNPDHERRVGDIAREVWPEIPITLGSDILREVREFERGSTAALNGYIQPIMTRYLDRIAARLKAGAVESELLVMQGNGGMMTAGIAGEKAVQTVMSGPAAGVIAAARLGATAGFPNLISCDMGGTSFDIAIVRAGCRPRRRRRTSPTACRSACPWWTSRPSAPAAAASRGSTKAASCASGPKAPARRRSDLLRQGRTRANGDRCQPAARPHRCPCHWRPRQPPDIDDVRGSSRTGSARRWASTKRRPPRDPPRWWTIKWRARRDSSRWTRGTTPATSPSSPSAVRGRCMRPPSPASSACLTCWCRASLASRRHSAACSPMCATTSCAPCISRLRTWTRGRPTASWRTRRRTVGRCSQKRESRSLRWRSSTRRTSSTAARVMCSACRWATGASLQRWSAMPSRRSTASGSTSCCRRCSPSWSTCGPPCAVSARRSTSRSRRRTAGRRWKRL